LIKAVVSNGFIKNCISTASKKVQEKGTAALWCASRQADNEIKQVFSQSVARCHWLFFLVRSIMLQLAVKGLRPIGTLKRALDRAFALCCWLVRRIKDPSATYAAIASSCFNAGVILPRFRWMRLLL
jgi:hypothetical protein